MKITNKEIWLTSDTHYGHANIVRGVSQWLDTDGQVSRNQTRDFDTVSQMNDTIVNNINNVVQPEDVLIHLGDWSFGGKSNISEFRERIHCNNVILITGNHDEHIMNNKDNCQSLFSHVAPYSEIQVTQRSGEKSLLVLFHYPILSWNKVVRCSVHLHGHMHSKGNDRFGNGFQMDVGLCGAEDLGFRPYHLDEVFKELRGRKRIAIPYDHHQ